MTPACLEALHAEYPAVQRWVIAYSGGLDSSVLLHLCARFAATRTVAPALHALHINHGVHPQAAAWQAHCARVCAGLGMAFSARCAQLDTKRSSPLSEDALRVARYREFEAFCGDGDLLLLAHHQDDQAETVLLRLLRGAGPSGLAAMPRTRMLGRARLYRPLLDTARSLLREYASANALAWIEDPANVSSEHDRSHLRSTVLPLLEQRWPGAAARIARAAHHCAEAAWICDERARQDLDALLGRDCLGFAYLALDAWHSLPAPRARNALRGWLSGQGLRVDARRIETVVQELIEARADRQPVIALEHYRLRRFADRLYIVEPSARVDEGVRIEPGHDEWLPGVGRLRLEHCATGVRAGGHYAVRFRQPGIRIRVAGRPHKSLKKLLQELALPPWLRDRVPLLYVDGELAAVADLCICEGFVATARMPAVRLRWQPADTPTGS